MVVDLYINEAFSVKRGLSVYAKSIGQDQPAQSAQADLGRYFFCYPSGVYISRNNTRSTS